MQSKCPLSMQASLENVFISALNSIAQTHNNAKKTVITYYQTPLTAILMTTAILSRVTYSKFKQFSRKRHVELYIQNLSKE